jgi:hypothetical protein
MNAQLPKGFKKYVRSFYVPLLICSDWLKQVKFKEYHLALLGFSDVHRRVPNGTLGSERVKQLSLSI